MPKTRKLTPQRDPTFLHLVTLHLTFQRKKLQEDHSRTRKGSSDEVGTNMEEAKVERRSHGETSIALTGGGSTGRATSARRPRGNGAGTSSTSLLQQSCASTGSRSDRLESSRATELASIGLVRAAGELVVLVKGESELVLGVAHRVRAISSRGRVVADAGACIDVQAADLAEQLAVVLGADVVGDRAGGRADHAGAELAVGDGRERVGGRAPLPVHSWACGGGGVRWVVGIGLHAGRSRLGDLCRQTAEVTKGADAVTVDGDKACSGEIGSAKDRYDAGPMVGPGGVGDR